MKSWQPVNLAKYLNVEEILISEFLISENKNQFYIWAFLPGWQTAGLSFRKISTVHTQ